MSPAIPVRTPRFAVKPVSHNDTRVSEAELQASVLSLTVQKRLHEPAGTFQLELAPRRQALAGGGVSSFHDVFQPMDLIEISVWVPPREKRVVMRGFVDVVEDSFSIEGGHPRHGNRSQ